MNKVNPFADYLQGCVSPICC